MIADRISNKKTVQSICISPWMWKFGVILLIKMRSFSRCFINSSPLWKSSLNSVYRSIRQYRGAAGPWARTFASRVYPTLLPADELIFTRSNNRHYSRVPFSPLSQPPRDPASSRRDAQDGRYRRWLRKSRSCWLRSCSLRLYPWASNCIMRVRMSYTLESSDRKASYVKT